MRTRFAACALLGLFAASTAHAQDGMYGDADGFGFGAPEVDGALWRDELGGVFFTDYRDSDDLADAPQTDIWDSNFGILDQPFTIETTQTGVDATFRIYIAGFADIGPADLFVDGDLLTTFDFPGEFQTTHILEVPVDARYIDGSTEFQLSTPDGDGYIIDYAALMFEGGLTLEYGGSCPGPVTATVSGATANGQVALLFATGPGHFTIPGGFTCAGTQLGLNSTVRLVQTGTADGTGAIVFSGNAPSAACNGEIQAIDVSTCTTSNTQTVN